MNYTYTLINPTSDRDFPALVGKLVIYGCEVEVINFCTIITDGRPELVDEICCNLHILVESDGQHLGSDD